MSVSDSVKEQRTDEHTKAILNEFAAARDGSWKLQRGALCDDWARLNGVREEKRLVGTYLDQPFY